MVIVEIISFLLKLIIIIFIYSIIEMNIKVNTKAHSQLRLTIVC